jgi:hypothetical protein
MRHKLLPFSSLLLHTHRRAVVCLRRRPPQCRNQRRQDDNASCEGFCFFVFTFARCCRGTEKKKTKNDEPSAVKMASFDDIPMGLLVHVTRGASMRDFVAFCCTCSRHMSRLHEDTIREEARRRRCPTVSTLAFGRHGLSNPNHRVAVGSCFVERVSALRAGMGQVQSRRSAVSAVQRCGLGWCTCSLIYAAASSFANGGGGDDGVGSPYPRACLD